METTAQPFTHVADDGTRTSLVGSAPAPAATTVEFTDPRSRSVQGWRARKGVLASRGEVDGPRVAEADAALAFWAVHKRLTAAVEAGTMPAENVEKVLDQLAAIPPRS